MAKRLQSSWAKRAWMFVVGRMCVGLSTGLEEWQTRGQIGCTGWKAPFVRMPKVPGSVEGVEERAG